MGGQSCESLGLGAGELACADCAHFDVSGCSTQTKQKWLTFFFDGVPVPGAGTNAVPKVAYDEDGRPIAPTGQRKKLPADWLID